MPKLLDFMINLNNASEDEANDILRMADHDSFSDRAEMEGYFTECLGYNPMTHFDRRSLVDLYDTISQTAPNSVQDKLIEKKEDIITAALECAAEVNETLLGKILMEIIKDTVGWAYSSSDLVSVDEFISMAIFGNAETFEDESDDEEEDLGLGLDEDDEELDVAVLDDEEFDVE